MVTTVAQSRYAVMQKIPKTVTLLPVRFLKNATPVGTDCIRRGQYNASLRTVRLYRYFGNALLVALLLITIGAELAAGQDLPAANSAPADKLTTTAPVVSEQNSNVDYGPYMAALQLKIKENWHPPIADVSKQVSVTFQVDSRGKASNITIETTSAIKQVDQAAIAAVRWASPFSSLPEGAPAKVDIQFTFDYNVLGRGKAPRELTQLLVAQLLAKADFKPVDHKALADILDELAGCYLERQEYKEAEPICKRSVAERRKLSIPGNSRLIQSLRNLARCYQNTGRYLECELLYKEVSTITQQGWQTGELWLWAASNERLRSALDLAWCYALAGKNTAAERLFKETVERTRETDGTLHLCTETALLQLALFYSSRKSCKLSDQSHSESLLVRAKRFALNKELLPLRQQATNYCLKGQISLAKTAFEKAIALEKEKGSSCRIDLAEDLISLANCQWLSARHAAATQSLKQALEISSLSAGVGNARTCEIRNLLGSLYIKEGQSLLAEQLYQQALPPAQSVDSNWTANARALGDLGRFYLDLRRYKQAEEAFHKRLQVSSIHAGALHPSTVEAREQLASFYVSQHRAPDAEALYKNLVSQFKHDHGEPSSDLADCLSHLAWYHFSQNHNSAAELALKKALSIRATAQEEIANNTRCNLALAYRRQGKFKDEEQLLTDSLAVAEKVYGVESRQTAEALNDLAWFAVDSKQFDHAGLLFQRAIGIAVHQNLCDPASTTWFISEIAEALNSRQAFRQSETFLKQQLNISDTEGCNSDSSLMKLLAEVLLRQAKYQEAAALYKKLLDHPTQESASHSSQDPLLQLAHIYYLQENTKTANELLNQPETKNPNASIDKLLDLALIYRKEKQYALADKLYRSLIARTVNTDAPAQAVKPVGFWWSKPDLTPAGTAATGHADITYWNGEGAARIDPYFRNHASLPYIPPIISLPRQQPSVRVSISDWSLGEATLSQEELRAYVSACLAGSLTEQGKYATAEQLFKHALPSLQKAPFCKELNNRHASPALAAALESYAQLLTRTARKAAASKVAAQAQVVKQKLVDRYPYCALPRSGSSG